MSGQTGIPQAPQQNGQPQPATAQSNQALAHPSQQYEENNNRRFRLDAVHLDEQNPAANYLTVSELDGSASYQVRMNLDPRDGGIDLNARDSMAAKAKKGGFGPRIGPEINALLKRTIKQKGELYLTFDRLKDDPNNPGHKLARWTQNAGSSLESSLEIQGSVISYIDNRSNDKKGHARITSLLQFSPKAIDPSRQDVVNALLQRIDNSYKFSTEKHENELGEEINRFSYPNVGFILATVAPDRQVLETSVPMLRYTPTSREEYPAHYSNNLIYDQNGNFKPINLHSGVAQAEINNYLAYSQRAYPENKEQGLPGGRVLIVPIKEHVISQTTPMYSRSPFNFRDDGSRDCPVAALQRASYQMCPSVNDLPQREGGQARSKLRALPLMKVTVRLTEDHIQNGGSHGFVNSGTGTANISHPYVDSRGLPRHALEMVSTPEGQPLLMDNLKHRVVMKNMTVRPLIDLIEAAKQQPAQTNQQPQQQAGRQGGPQQQSAAPAAPQTQQQPPMNQQQPVNQGYQRQPPQQQAAAPMPPQPQQPVNQNQGYQQPPASQQQPANQQPSTEVDWNLPGAQAAAAPAETPPLSADDLVGSMGVPQESGSVRQDYSQNQGSGIPSTPGF